MTSENGMDRPCLLPLTVRWGFEARGTHCHDQKRDAVVASTIGIDTGKNTLHLIGLDGREAIVLREKLARGRIGTRLANVTASAAIVIYARCS
jgi:hypothetical protein